MASIRLRSPKSTCACHLYRGRLTMPTSPLPVTGFTITVLKSEAVDLNISVDQAIQFIVSCGVVVPPQQIQQTSIPFQISAAITKSPSGNGQHGSGKDAEQQSESSVDAAE